VVAAGRFAPGHLGELTRIVPFEMVDAVLEETGKVEQRVRDLPARVVVYLLLAAGLFEGLGWRKVWGRLVAGLDGLDVADPSSAALWQARARLGVAPLRALFELLRGASGALSTRGVFWRRLLVVALDGSTLTCPDGKKNLSRFLKGGGNHGGTGHPQVRLVALIACGTRTLVDAVSGPTSAGETAYAATLAARALRAGTIVLADRGFAGTPTIKTIAATGADLLVRVTGNRRLPVLRTLPDGSWISRIGPVELRALRCEITVTTTGGTRRTGHYLLVTTVLDPSVPAAELIRLYHDRWEVETAFLELKSTILGGEVLRSRTPDGVEQEVYALLVTYQAIRIAIADATLGDPALDPDRGSFTTALQTARDQVVKAAGVIEGETVDLVGVIGRTVLADLLPDRRLRVSPRVVKRAISNYAASTAKGRLHKPSYKATLSVDILAPHLDRARPRQTSRHWG